MNKYIWSPSLAGFFPTNEQANFEAVGEWPVDGVDVSTEQHGRLFPVPEGKYIGTVNGLPAWVDNPPLTQKQRVALAEADRQARMDAANSYMNSRQWPGKASLGRLKPEEQTQYGAWLDYLDALDVVDTSLPDDIRWPVSPVK